MKNTLKENTTAANSGKLRTMDHSGLPTKHFTVTHALSHIGQVNSTIDSENVQIEVMNKKLADCRALMAQLSDKSSHSNEDLLANLKTSFERIYENFTVQVTLQKQENDKMQQKIDKLKKEKTEIQQLIISYAKRSAELEQELGKYPH
jgi:chromosome segregation ATPase